MVQDSVYPYKFRVSADGGRTWSWVGTGGVPYGGEDLHLGWFLSRPTSYVTLTDASTKPWGAVVFEFGQVDSVQGATRHTQFVNTSTIPVTISPRNGATWIADDPDGRFSATIADCDDEATCTVELEAGEALALDLAFVPGTSTEGAAATLQFNVTAHYPGASPLTEGASIQLTGSAL